MPNGPEDNPPPGGTRGGTRRESVAGGAGGRVPVDLTDIATGEPQDSYSRLLQEIKDCCETQTKTLGKQLEEIKNSILQDVKVNRRIERGGKEEVKATGDLAKEIGKEFGKEFRIAITQLKTAPGTVGEAGEAAADLSVSFGATAAATRTAEDRLKNLKEVLEKTTPQVSKWAGLFVTGVGLEFKQTMRELNASMQSLATTLRRDATRAIKDTFKTGMELARTGLVDLEDTFTDAATAITEGRDNLVITYKSLQKSLQEGLITPIGTFGTTLHETARNLTDFREAVGEDFKFAKAFKSVEDMNVGVSTLVDLQLRSGIKTDIRDSLTQQRIAEQLENLRLIASIGGKQLEEIIASRGKQNKTDAVLVEQGLITYEQAVRTTELQQLLGSVNAQKLADAIEVLKQNGAFTQGLEPALAAMTEQERLLFSQNPELAQTLLAAAKAGTPEKQMEILQQTLAENRFQGAHKLTQDAVANRQASELFSELNALKQLNISEAMTNIREKEASEKGRKTLDDTIRSIALWIDSRIAPDLNKIFWSTASIAGMLAISGITKIGRSFLGRGGGAAAAAAGGIGAITRGGGGLARTTIPAVSAAAAAIPGAAKAAGVLGRGAGLLGRLIPGLGTAISGGLAIKSFMQGDLIGGLLHGGASIASLFPGIGTAAALGLEGLALGRDVLAPAAATAAGVSPTPTAPAAVSAPGSPQKMLLEHMQAQTNSLRKLVALSEVSNTIGRDISDRIGRPERAVLARDPGASGIATYAPDQAVGS